jgi:MoaA/NifB/PqqE/SkfB family radical SAM enzyme
MTQSKYSSFKIAAFPDKIRSLINGDITAPLYVRIKPINACNHNCGFCAYKKGQYIHDNCNRVDSLTTKKLLEVINDIADIGVKGVVFSGGGEPLLHKGIVPAFESCSERGLKIGLITNGQALTSSKIDSLINASWVRLSVDYWDAESFSASRGVANKYFDKILANVLFLSAKKSDSCDLEINFIITKENYRHIQEAAEMVKGLGVDNIRFCPAWGNDFINYHAPIQEEVLTSIQEAQKLSNDKFKVYSSYDGISESVFNRPYRKCYFNQVCTVIAADYNVYFCHDKSYSSVGVIGSIKDQKFSDLWFSQDTKGIFDNFNPQESCNGHRCSSENRNLFIHEILGCANDPFI